MNLCSSVSRAVLPTVITPFKRSAARTNLRVLCHNDVRLCENMGFMMYKNTKIQNFERFLSRFSVVSWCVNNIDLLLLSCRSYLYECKECPHLQDQGEYFQGV